MNRNPIKLAILCTACVVLGVAGGAILNAGAQSGGHQAGTGAGFHAQGHFRGGGPFAGHGPRGGHGPMAGLGARGLLGRVVHADLTVTKPDGSFAAVTVDQGVAVSVAGDQLTLTEGPKATTPKTVVVTIPAAAKVIDNRAKATLADVKAGQHVIVIQAPKVTAVLARDAP